MKNRYYSALSGVTIIDDVVPASFEDKVDAAYAEAKALLLKKHADYGPGNIASTPVGPEVGLIVRIYDKVARLAHLKKANRKPNNESLRDSWLDIANYGIIGVLVNDGSWPTNGDDK